MKPIGVLGLQGDFDAHRAAMEEAGAPARVIRRAEDLAGVSGLIIPGGESTTLLRLMADTGFLEAIHGFHRSGRPLFGTCAGAILLAARVHDPDQPSLGLIDIDIRRNAYGRQNESFETREAAVEGEGAALLPEEGGAPLHMVFIRAPRIVRCGPSVSVLVRHAGDPVLVRQGKVLAGTFHPEMAPERRIHRFFAKMASNGAIAD